MPKPSHIPVLFVLGVPNPHRHAWIFHSQNSPCINCCFGVPIKTHFCVRPYSIKPFLKGYIRAIIEPIFFAGNVDFVSHGFVMSNEIV